jgi:hypothetical protein
MTTKIRHQAGSRALLHRRSSPLLVMVMEANTRRNPSLFHPDNKAVLPILKTLVIRQDRIDQSQAVLIPGLGGSGSLLDPETIPGMRMQVRQLVMQAVTFLKSDKAERQETCHMGDYPILPKVRGVRTRGDRPNQLWQHALIHGRTLRLMEIEPRQLLSPITHHMETSPRILGFRCCSSSSLKHSS